MSGTKALLDSNVIIYASQGVIDAEKLLSASEGYFVSIITLIEVYGFDFADARERALIDEIINSLEIVELDRAIADQAIKYRKVPTKKIKLPDAVILATATILGADLFTANIRDFPKIDDAVNVIDIGEFKL